MPGWTDGWLVADSELGNLHRHCFTCFNVKRCTRQGDACKVVSCPLDCGAQYHACKAQEHALLCPLARVPCINASFGCSLTLLRSELAAHLPSCPASILACTQEWNRWPLYCKDRLKAVPFRQKNPQAQRGQLDFELALRDQAIVGDLHKIPRRTKLALRNHLTRRYPALPLPRGADCRPPTTDCSDKSQRELTRVEVGDGEHTNGFHHGIAKVFHRNQEIQRKRWQDDVDTAIQRTGQPVPRKYWEYPEFEKGDIHEHCAYCYNIDCDKTYSYGGDGKRGSCAVIQCQWGCGSHLHACKAFEHQMLCPFYDAQSELDHMAAAVEGRVFNKSKKKLAKAPPPPKEHPSLLAPPCELPEARRFRKPLAPGQPGDIHMKMRFDIKVETVTKLQVKPRAMYTFLCGAELRRDQWEGHCRNVHSEIHGGLNNWIEARCPLASYGCGFAARRLYPGEDPRAEVVYCQATQSFGIRPPPVSVKPGGDISLGDLPAELLHHVFSFLDPRSLASVALVSQHLRGVACSLLDTMGCVALQWERSESPGGGWEVAYKRWFFSPYFQPVNKWGLHSEGVISEHLQNCPFNIRTEHKRQEKSSPQAKEFMKALGVKMKQKQESEWFIK